MKLRTSTILGLLLVPLLVPAPAGAAETYHFSSRGQFADAYFRSTDPSGCVETIVSVAAVDRLVKVDGSPATRESWVLVTIVQRDVCTGTLLIGAVGMADLASEQFRVERLDTAALNASIAVDDVVSGVSFAVEIALAWQATADPVRFREHVLVHEPGGLANARVDCTGALCTGRGGTVVGTVTDGATDFTPEPGTGALGTAKEGEVVVIRG